MFTPHPKLHDTVFVVFSDDWGRHPSSCQHLFLRVLPHSETLWVNTVGLRIPRFSLYDLRRAREILGNWFSPRRPAPTASGSEMPRVLRPVMLPFFQWGWARAMNRIMIQRKLRRALQTFAPGRQKILVSTLPIIPFAFRMPEFARKVYYCVDDFTTWPGVSGRTMERLERETLPACDLVIATSSQLLESRGAKARSSRLLTHGVDLEYFAQPKISASRLENIPHPILGMFGSFDARVDADILRALSRALPKAHLVVLGPVDRDRGKFEELPNLHFLGAVPYAELPGEAARFDVCILPYKVDSSTRNINPLKLKEYLATGKPVVSTPLPEAVKLAPYLRIADRDQFATAVSEALQDEVSRPGLTEFLAQESWDVKAEQFFGWILADL